MKNKYRSFLKWAGGKYRLIDHIRQHLPEGDRLVEPFVGAGSVFLNTDFDRYLLNDINPDLIHLYKCIQKKPIKYIKDAKELFTPEYNRKEAYYEIRNEFNQLKPGNKRRAVLFLYLNRHGYNGLCRYNNSGGFNVPFGKNNRPYFPEEELAFFAEKSQKATFVCKDFVSIFKEIAGDDTVYCDPPYIPLSKTSYFTSYASGGFTIEQQQLLAQLAHDVSLNKGANVLLSNHATEWTKEAYNQACITKIVPVGRAISQNGQNRRSVEEILALYKSKC